MDEPIIYPIEVEFKKGAYITMYENVCTMTIKTLSDLHQVFEKARAKVLAQKAGSGYDY